mmetsp:Transcript_29987/g.84184  ORF Transcript_29987/g.84184 Transcript_29987/m.84184 type:complete len:260 (+) Transcript_29987:198-977(+)
MSKRPPGDRAAAAAVTRTRPRRPRRWARPPHRPRPRCRSAPRRWSCRGWRRGGSRRRAPRRCCCRLPSGSLRKEWTASSWTAAASSSCLCRGSTRPWDTPGGRPGRVASAWPPRKSRSFAAGSPSRTRAWTSAARSAGTRAGRTWPAVRLPAPRPRTATRPRAGNPPPGSRRRSSADTRWHGPRPSAPSRCPPARPPAAPRRRRRPGTRSPVGPRRRSRQRSSGWRCRSRRSRQARAPWRAEGRRAEPAGTATRPSRAP